MKNLAFGRTGRKVGEIGFDDERLQRHTVRWVKLIVDIINALGVTFPIVLCQIPESEPTCLPQKIPLSCIQRSTFGENLLW